eukprot:scaffold45746_cov36-Cyclotella_meneghiniana.AAC.2
MGHYPGCAMLSGIPHVLTVYTTGGFESHCNVRQSKNGKWCESKNKDRSVPAHDLKDDPGYPKKESQTFWKGMLEGGGCAGLCCCPNRQPQGDLHPLPQILVSQKGEGAHPA